MSNSEVAPRLFNVSGIGGQPPRQSQIKAKGVTSEPVDVTLAGQRIPKGATVKLTVWADVEEVSHKDVFETLDGIRERVGTIRVHSCKCTHVDLVSWTAPDDGLRFADGRVGPHLSEVADAAQGLIEAGCTSVSLTTADLPGEPGTTRTVDLRTGEVAES